MSKTIEELLWLPKLEGKKEEILTLIEVATQEQSNPVSSSNECHPSYNLVIEFLEKHKVSIKNEFRKGDADIIQLKECVFDSDHNRGESGIFVNDEGLITYHCFHDSCSGKTYPELKEKLEGKPRCKYCGEQIEWDEREPYNSDGRRHKCNREFSENDEVTSYKEYPVCRFTARLTRTITHDNQKVTYKLILKNDRFSKEIELSGQEFYDYGSFKKAVAERGFQTCRGLSKCFEDYIQHLEGKSAFKEIKSTVFYGKIAKGTFLFSNVIVEKGKTAIEDATNHYSAPKKNRIEYKSGLYAHQLKDMLQQLCGEEFYKILGFCVGTFFVKEIHDKYGFFPLLFLYDDSRRGKSTLAHIIMGCFGAAKSIKPINFNSTIKASQRLAAKLHSIPLVFNEFVSNDKNNLTLCSFYDRENRVTASFSNDLEVNDPPINCSFVVISTNNIVGYKSEDVVSRLVEVDFDRINNNKLLVDQLKEYASDGKLAEFVVHCMQEIETEQLFDLINDRIKDNRTKCDVHDRFIENYSIIQACAMAFLYSLNQQEEAIKLTENENFFLDMQLQQEKTSDQKCGKTFLNLLYAFLEKSNVNSCFDYEYAHASYKASSNQLIFRMKKTWEDVRRYGKSCGVEVADKKDIERSLKSLGGKYKSIRIKNSTYKGWVVPYEDDRVTS